MRLDRQWKKTGGRACRFGAVVHGVHGTHLVHVFGVLVARIYSGAVHVVE